MPSRSRITESVTEQLDGQEALGEKPAPRPKKRMKRGWRITLIVLTALLMVVGASTVALGLYARSVEKGIDRVDAFNGVPEENRPQKPAAAADAKNLLLLGSDSRDPDSTSGSRSDTIIVAHIPQDRSSAQLISIPRDTWVPVPKSQDGKNGGRTAKINASYAWGGLPLMVQTVEQFSGVRIDHVVIIDFSGFQQIVDALGGVTIDVESNFKSIHPPYRQFTKGVTQMDGATALDYSRQRKQFADGDFARIRHQQQVIRAILDKASSGGLLSSPTKLNSFLRATANAVSVDQTLSIFDMANELKGVRGEGLTFITVPTKGTGMEGSESVVYADNEADKTLFDAVRRDSVKEILATPQKK
ncbi:LCP family protein [Dactylosporangium sp. NPDC051541]|uniref:LCP family protein n=1 Tax=Dactylosporangium sp. NPDC051541 TaxID=3363977 RepID=UPI0037AFC93B